MKTQRSSTRRYTGAQLRTMITSCGDGCCQCGPRSVSRRLGRLEVPPRPYGLALAADGAEGVTDKQRRQEEQEKAHRKALIAVVLASPHFREIFTEEELWSMELSRLEQLATDAKAQKRGASAGGYVVALAKLSVAAGRGRGDRSEAQTQPRAAADVYLKPPSPYRVALEREGCAR